MKTTQKPFYKKGWFSVRLTSSLQSQFLWGLTHFFYICINNFKVRIMKRVLLFTLLISFIGYSQNPIQPNIPNFDDDFSNDLTESTNSSSIDTYGNGFLNIFPTRESNTSETQSYQRLQQDEMSLRLFHWKDGFFDELSGIPTTTTENLYDDNGNVTLEITDNWDVDTQSYIPSYKNESTYDENGNLTLYISNYWDIDTQSYIPSYKNESTYDENGNLTLYILLIIGT